VAYSVWWNRRHQRSGHVFGGRFKAVLVEAGQWVVACSVYLHLNPVAIQVLGLSKGQKALESKGLARAERALIAKRLEKLRSYGWSSYPAYAGYDAPPPWLSTEELWSRTGGPAAYRRLGEERIRGGQEDSLWSQLKWGLVLGGARFAEEARKRIKVNRESTERSSLRRRSSWAEVVMAVESSRKEKWERFAERHGDPGMAMTFYLGRRCTGLTLRELGEAAGAMDYSAVAAAIRRFKGRLAQDRMLQSQTGEILRDPQKS